MALLLLLGCSSKPAETEAELEARLLALPKSAPEWIYAPHNKTRLGASGAALPMRAGIQFQQIEASTRAKEALTKTVAAYTEQAAVGVYGAMGVEIGPDGLRSIGLMAASQAIVEAKRSALYWAPSNELYIHLTLSRQETAAIGAEAIRLSIRSRARHEAAYRALGDRALIDRAVSAAFTQDIQQGGE
jgi:hypothetical protein